MASAAQAVHGRERSEAPGRVGFIELFFDLVFVFAITQVSHLLLDHLSWTGAAETAFVLVAVWWTWITVLWWTDWVGTESGVVRLELVAAMVACMLMAIAIPEAFGDRGLLFAAGYIGARAPMHAYGFVALPREQYPKLAAVTIWSAAAGTCDLVARARRARPCRGHRRARPVTCGVREPARAGSLGFRPASPRCRSRRRLRCCGRPPPRAGSRGPPGRSG